MKTTATDSSATDYLGALSDAGQSADGLALLQIMEAVSGFAPKIWGTSMIGFGVHHYRYESGTEGETFVVGFAPRRGKITVYLTAGIEPQADLLPTLGKHTLGKGCLYFKRLADIDEAVLRAMVERSVKALRPASITTPPGTIPESRPPSASGD